MPVFAANKRKIDDLLQKENHDPVIGAESDTLKKKKKNPLYSKMYDNGRNIIFIDTRETLQNEKIKKFNIYFMKSV